ncbi:hypothetical protein ACBJ59_10990 [Nonomuraea sp. MTCD27]|uniref:hypothetical protein n=1 Tax=Nonomuraea sp. MTCD27 TaxID=1676747 RepID=UPI0035BF3366
MNATVNDTRRQARAWYRHLNQDTTWVPATGVPTLIADMDPAWRFNAANWLIKRVSNLVVAYSYGEGLIMAEPLGRDMDTGDLVYVEMPHEVDLSEPYDDRFDDPEGWLRATPLYQALINDLPDDIADLARHWSTCDLRIGQGTACSCWERHLTECPVNMIRDITASCHCRDDSPEWTI